MKIGLQIPSFTWPGGAAELVAERGLRVGNVDATMLIERPKIGAHRAQMRERLAAAIGVEPAAVNIKATTGEGIGFVGRVEGVAALAVATLHGV